jgi:hypothetical protein
MGVIDKQLCQLQKSTSGIHFNRYSYDRPGQASTDTTVVVVPTYIKAHPSCSCPTGTFQSNWFKWNTIMKLSLVEIFIILAALYTNGPLFFASAFIPNICSGQSQRCRTISNTSKKSSEVGLGATRNIVEAASGDLLFLLLKRFNSQTTGEEDKEIENLMGVLQDSRTSFDPEKCLNGPLYAALYQSGPQPFWERFDFRLSFGNGRKNIKGQQYLKNAEGNYDVLNYAEFVGKFFSVEAVGTCRKNRDQDLIAVDKGIMLNPFLKLFKNAERSVSSLVKCPADYTIQATGVTFQIFDNKKDIDIQGTGYMRMLYADENLRILTSPKDTTSSGNAVDEKAGLTVAQVRVNLIDPDFRI